MYKKEIELTIKTVKNALKILNKKYSKNSKILNVDKKEFKTTTDYYLEEYIIKKLLKTNKNILTEERGLIVNNKYNSDCLWIVDPLDGTHNFIRDFLSCSISIAYIVKGELIFGVIGDYPSLKIAWGGKNYRSFYNNKKINTSKIKDKKESSVLTGFPSRLKLTYLYKSKFFKIVSNYSKVRMIGSASISLLNLARGKAETYFEQDIMIWDVAAGLAILEGAGGQFTIEKGSLKYSFNVFASNNLKKKKNNDKINII